MEIIKSRQLSAAVLEFSPENMGVGDKTPLIVVSAYTSKTLFQVSGFWVSKWDPGGGWLEEIELCSAFGFLN